MLRHSDVDGRNVIVRYVPFIPEVFPIEVNQAFSHSSLCRVLAIIDGDFSNPHALLLADEASRCLPQKTAILTCVENQDGLQIRKLARQSYMTFS